MLDVIDRRYLIVRRCQYCCTSSEEGANNAEAAFTTVDFKLFNKPKSLFILSRDGNARAIPKNSVKEKTPEKTNPPRNAVW